jgi:hypothetical protein
MGIHTKKLGLRALYIAVFVALLGIPIEISQQRPPEPPPITTQSGVTPANPVDAGRLVGQASKLFSSPRWAESSPSAPTTQQPAKLAMTNKKKVSFATKGVVRDLQNKTVTIDGQQYPLRNYTPLATPNDPSASQWWITNTQLNQAWDTPAGNNETILAVIDTGFGLKHEEFANRWYQSPGESGAATTEAPSTYNCTGRGLAISASCNLIDEDSDGIVDNETGSATYENPSRLNCSDQQKPLTKDCNRIDDDGNSLTDDVTGWDFANNDNSTQAGELNPSGSGTTHGTQTAGAAAATGNNAKGIAGVDWHTKVLPIQALDDDSYGDTLGVGRAIAYATSQHVDVINLSLGSTFPDSYVREMIAQAIAAGIVVVAAAGNTSCDCMVYPANYPEVVAVGALNSSSQLASFSSYGTNLDILAPGTQITAPTWSAANPAAAYASNLAGTSFSTPIVSGLITRLLSSQPNMTPLQLIAAVTENTNRLALPASVSRTAQLGYGSLNGYKATNRITTPRNSTFAYNYSPVSKGGYLTPATPMEVTGTYAVQACADGQLGTTPLYEMSKAGSSFWTISQSEVWQAVDAGYATQLFAEACLSQPLDTVDASRNVDLFKEFRNLYKAL